MIEYFLGLAGLAVALAFMETHPHEGGMSRWKMKNSQRKN